MSVAVMTCALLSGSRMNVPKGEVTSLPSMVTVKSFSSVTEKSFAP